jgi:hypothetical protein
VDHDADPAFGQPERLGRRRVEHPVHRLDFQEVVPRPEADDLVQPPVQGTAADLCQAGVFRNAVILAPVQVLLAAVAARDGVAGPAGLQLFQLRPAAQVP